MRSQAAQFRREKGVDKPKPAILEPGKVVRFKLGQSVNLA